MKFTTKLIIDLACNGNKLVQKKVSDLLNESVQFKMNKKVILNWMKERANSGDVIMQRRLADYYMYDATDDKDVNKAFYWYLNAAKSNDEYCLFELLKCYENGLGTKKDLKKVVETEFRLGQLGILYYQLKIARRYFVGKGIATDYEFAFNIFKSQSDISIEAKIYMANCYYYGIGTKQNVLLALNIWDECKKEIEDLSPRTDDKEFLDRLKLTFYYRFYLGFDVENPDYELTYLRCLELKETNLKFALYRLGLMDYSGFGVESNRSVAENELIEAVRLGSKDAHEFLMKIY